AGEKPRAKKKAQPKLLDKDEREQYKHEVGGAETTEQRFKRLVKLVEFFAEDATFDVAKIVKNLDKLGKIDISADLVREAKAPQLLSRLKKMPAVEVSEAAERLKGA
ncbi:unnamed protein product, partial [Chrysoparadoxa australica]